MSMIRLGDLDRVLTLEKRVLSPDGAGGMNESWVAVTGAATVYAAVRDLTGGQRQRMGQTLDRATHRIVTTYRPDIVAGMRLCEGTHVYMVMAVLDTAGGREYLEIMATSGDGM